MLPLMAEKKDSQYELKSVLRKAMQLSAYLVFPMMGILAACASSSCSFGSKMGGMRPVSSSCVLVLLISAPPIYELAGT